MYDDDILKSNDDILAKKPQKNSRSSQSSSSAIEKILGDLLDETFVGGSYVIPSEVDIFGHLCKVFSNFQSTGADNPQWRAMYYLIDRESEGELTELTEIFALEQFIATTDLIYQFAESIYSAIVNIDNQFRSEAIERFELYMMALRDYCAHAVEYYLNEYKETCSLYSHEPDPSIIENHTFDYVTPSMHYNYKIAVKGMHFRYGDISHVRDNVERTVSLMIDGLIEKLKKIPRDSIS